MNVEAQTLELGWAEQRPLCSRAQGTILIIIPGRACRVIINASLGQNQSVSLIAKQKAAFPLVCKRGREKESGENDKLSDHFNSHSSRLYGWRRKWPPAPVLLPGESHGQRSLAGYSPWGRKESDTTEQLTHTGFMGPSGMKSKCTNCKWNKENRASQPYIFNPISQAVANLTFKDIWAQIVGYKGRMLRISWLGPNPIYTAKFCRNDQPNGDAVPSITKTVSSIRPRHLINKHLLSTHWWGHDKAPTRNICWILTSTGLQPNWETSTYTNDPKSM